MRLSHSFEVWFVGFTLLLPCALGWWLDGKNSGVVGGGWGKGLSGHGGGGVISSSFDNNIEDRGLDNCPVAFLPVLFRRARGGDGGDVGATQSQSKSQSKSGEKNGKKNSKKKKRKSSTTTTTTTTTTATASKKSIESSDSLPDAADFPAASDSPPSTTTTTTATVSGRVLPLSTTSLPTPPPFYNTITVPRTLLSSLDLFSGDAVLVRRHPFKVRQGEMGPVLTNSDAGTATGDTRGAVVVTVIEGDDSDDGVKIGSQCLSNMGLSPDSVGPVSVEFLDVLSPPPSSTVVLTPYESDLKAAMNRNPDLSLFEDYVKPYFEENQFALVGEGDRIVIKDVMFRVCEIVKETKSPSSDEEELTRFGIVGPDTVVEYADDPLSDADRTEPEQVGYDTLGGLENQVQQLNDLILTPLRHPELYTSLGISPPRGVLLTGASGTGKTSLAKAVAAESGAYFFVINGGEVVSKKAGESEANLRRAFEDARDNAEEYGGAIVFIDEIDAIGGKREKAGGETEKRVVSQLLTLMDGLGEKGDRIVVVGATNRPGTLEPALRRAGRFDRELDLGVPTEEGRLEILKIKTEKMNYEGGEEMLEKLAKETHGFVGADIEMLVMEAGVECIRRSAGWDRWDGGQDGEDVNDDSKPSDSLLKSAFANGNMPASIDPSLLQSIVVKPEDFAHALSIVHPSSLRENNVEIPDVKWSDVGGLQEVKRELHETVQYPVEFADKFIKFGMHPSKGVLFYGPSGCGKTLLAKAIANECNANFISVKGPELLTQWFGESEANVRELFDKARAAAPCILMFDEIDSIAKTRGGSSGGSEAADRVINQILTEIDGVGARKNVFVIGATNRPDVLDPAVIRPGRLDQLIYIPLPDLDSRKGIFKACLSGAPVDPSVNVDVLARSTSGFSGADIAEVCQAASKCAVREAIAEAEAGGQLSKDSQMKIQKRHFNEAMSRARRSVGEGDLKVFETFKEKQSIGKSSGGGGVGGGAEFRFKDGKGGEDNEITESSSPKDTKEDDAVEDDDLY